jgi:thiazole synthase
MTTLSNDPLVLYGQTFQSRLLLGTARYPSPDLLEAAVKRAKPAMLTASLRRQTAKARARPATTRATASGRCCASWPCRCCPTPPAATACRR